MDKGCLVISLDYELMWGVHDVCTIDGYGKSNIVNVPIAIDRILDLFGKYEVHATFATVGMLMCRDKKEMLDWVPPLLPSYDMVERSPYAKIDAIKDFEQHLYFQPNILEKLKYTEGIEIGTHTYCHYYCWEKGQNIDQFDADIKTAVELASQKGIAIKSIVFPRNQVSVDYLSVCAKYGIKYYRGNTEKFFSEPRTFLESVKNKVCRLLDAYWNVGGMTTIPYEKMSTNSGLINVQASRFIRPYSRKIAFFDSFRLKRICEEMEYAAKYGQCYHIWWHPHNFGANIDKNLLFLEEILKCYKACREKYGMVSLTMSELGANLEK